MKGSIEVKSLKLLDIGAVKCSIQFGWAFITAVTALVLMFIVARASFTMDVQKQFADKCQYEQTLEDATVKQLYPKTWQNHRRDVQAMCNMMHRSDLNILLDYDAWSYRDVYGDKRFKK